MGERWARTGGARGRIGLGHLLLVVIVAAAPPPAHAQRTRREEALERAFERLKQAGLEFQKGALPHALTVAEEARMGFERALGPEDPLNSQALFFLGEVQRTLGQLDKAQVTLERAIFLAERAPPEMEAMQVAPLMALGVILFQRHDLDRAEALTLRALHIVERRKPDHVKLASICTTLGWIRKERGDLVGAERYFARATARAAGVPPPSTDRASASVAARALSTDRMILLNNRALLAYDRGERAKAVELFEESIRVGRAGAPGSLALAQTLLTLALTHELMGRNALAVATLGEALTIVEKNLIIVLSSGSAAQKAAYLSNVEKFTDAALSIAASEAGDERAVWVGLQASLQRKGRALDAEARSLELLRLRTEPEVRGDLDRVVELRARLARAMAGEQLEDEGSVREALETVERRLAEKSAAFRADESPVAAETVVKEIGPHTALVDFACFEPYGEVAESRSEERQCVAFVLLGGSRPIAVPLGPEVAIEAAVGRFRRSLQTPRRADWLAAGRELGSRVFEPLRPALGNSRRVLLAPDGMLHLLPFAALPDRDGRPLLEAYTFSYLSSGRDVLRFLEAPAPLRAPPVVIAGPEFDGPGPKASKPAIGHFEPLPGALREGTDVAAIIQAPVRLTGAHATESAVRALHGPSVLHIATHGFYLADVPRARPASRRGARGITLALQTQDDPQPGGAPKLDGSLVRSGIALAGANVGGANPGEDGVLTAMEAMNLDLWTTRLVTLSACQTGVGEVTGREGVFGLRRALLLAGSQSQLTALWQVDDDATAVLMRGFYRRLRAGQERAEALRGAQIELAAAPVTESPFFWAAFILSGDPRSFDGRTQAPGLPPAVRSPRACGCRLGDGGAPRLEVVTPIIVLALIWMVRARPRRAHGAAWRPQSTPCRK